MAAPFLAIAGDLLFWRQDLGANVLVFTVLWLGLLLAYCLAEGVRPRPGSLILPPAALFFAFVFLWRDEPLTLLLSAAAVFLAVTLFLMSAREGLWRPAGFLQWCDRFIRLLGDTFIQGAVFAVASRQERRGSDDGRRRRASVRFGPVLRGALIALPLLVLLTALLASADAVFGARLGSFMELFRLQRLPEYLLRIVIIAYLAVFFMGAFRHPVRRSPAEARILGGRGVRPFLGFTESVVILGSVAALFAFFVAGQFRYFFGGEAVIDAGGLTYAEYARRGFAELVAVALISLLLLLVLGAVSRREGRRRQALFAGLGAVVALLVMVMLVSAYQRLELYEAAYGFTRLRIYTHVFMIWLGALLLATALMELAGRRRFFIATAAVAAMGFIATLGVVNVDAFIVERNIQRAVDGRELDTGYLSFLSDDAVPPLVDAYRSTELPESVREDIGEVLWVYKECQSDESGSWRSYNASRHRAAELLDGLEIGH